MKELVARYKKTTGCEAEVRDFFAAMKRLSEMMIHDIYCFMAKTMSRNTHFLINVILSATMYLHTFITREQRKSTTR